ncbi:MAG: peptidoglycan DD-metalloendopeptidase family protein [Bacteroidetes bacterium]|jgi:murein DD-endopeptidase MepM/ murein hydrolase activator NlpD|nr:peptidoglycan DD-metalloendopeptidase family protein [Bacteroidota bacterium]
MPKNKYFYYDHETCSFVEVKPDPRKVWLRRGAIGGLVVVVAVALSFLLESIVPSVEQMTLRAENQALQQELEQVNERVTNLSSELGELSEADQALYRTLFEAEPIPSDVRQVGVGGSDAQERFDSFSSRPAVLLRHLSEELDALERKASLQSSSFRELKSLAGTHQERMRQLPAILPANGPVVSGFGRRFHPILQVRRHHAGIDIVLEVGTPVYTTGDGVVRERSRTAGYGKYVIIDHPQAGYSTLYAHLSEIPSHIRRGREVKRGEEIARSGNTGRSTGPHLHYEIRDSNDRAIDPTQLMAPSMSPQRYQHLVMAAENASTSLD